MLDSIPAGHNIKFIFLETRADYEFVILFPWQMWLQNKSSQSFVKCWEVLQVLQESVCIDLNTTASTGRTDRVQAFQNSTCLRLAIRGSMNWPSKLSNGSLSHKLAFRRPNCN